VKPEDCRRPSSHGPGRILSFLTWVAMV